MNQQQIEQLARKSLDLALKDLPCTPEFTRGVASGLGIATGAIKALCGDQKIAHALLVAMADDLDRREEEQVRSE